MLFYQKRVTDLRITNEYMQENLNKFISQNQDEDDQLRYTPMKIRHKSIGGRKKMASINVSQLSNHFITKYLNKLKNNVSFRIER